MANAKDIDLLTAKRKELVWGQSGSGKTWYIGTHPKPYVFDFDGGIATLARQDVEYDYYDPKDAEAFRKFDITLRQFERAKIEAIDTVALDSITTLQEAIEGHVQMLNNHTGQQMQLQEWGQVIDKLSDVLYRITRLTKIGYHVVVTAHEQYKHDESTGRLLVLPLVVGKELPGRLPLWFDEVYYAYSERTKDGKLAYWLQTQRDSAHLAKTRFQSLASSEVPDFVKLTEKMQAGRPLAPAQEKPV